MRSFTSSRVDRTIRVLFVSGWILLLAINALAVYRGKAISDPLFAGAAAALTVFTLAAFRRSTRLLAVIASITLVVPLVMFELYLGASQAVPQSGLDHAVELRERGQPVYLSFYRGDIPGLEKVRTSPFVLDGRPILPLADIPDSRILYCGRREGWIVFRTDGLGFRNPAPAPAAIRTAILGDSFVKGFCVPEQFTYGALLAALGPVRSFGADDTSVLSQYAIYREYIRRFKPELLVWFFYAGSDLTDFWAERQFEPLRRYLAAEHVQGLADRAARIGDIQKKYMDERVFGAPDGAASRKMRRHWAPTANRFWDIVTLKRTRKSLRPRGPILPRGATSLEPAHWEVMAMLWRRVIGLQKEHGGRVVFVYLPEARRYLADDPAPFEMIERRVRGFWTALGADFISVSDMLAGMTAPLELYDRERIHFTSRGYEKSAEFILGRLTAARPAPRHGRRQ